MLRQLVVRDFALIERIDLTFNSGMTVLLGETGAGKSIIIDSLAAALGGRLSSDSIRTGAKKCVIEATFSSVPEVVRNACKDHDLDVFDDELILRRELNMQGHSRCFINDTPVSATTVRAISAPLMDFHGQHDTHGLLHVSRHREVLDQFAGTSSLVHDMHYKWQDVQDTRKHEADLQQRAANADADRARLQYLLDEITSVNPTEDEDSQLTVELRKAESIELITGAADSARELLYAGNNSAYDTLREAKTHLTVLAEFDPSLSDFLQDIETALTICKEAAGSLMQYASGEEHSVQQLDAMRVRLQLLQRLVRKYGTLADAITRRTELSIEISDLESMDTMLEDARKDVERAVVQARKAAVALSKKRKTIVDGFAQAVQDSLRKMGMPAAEFRISIKECELNAHGIDDVEFLISANAGESPRALSKVASGGELSRLMLAIKTALSRTMTNSTMVFDEIDTGISGGVARSVGEIMQTIAANQQILCITHLAQIASLSDNFVAVKKSTLNNGTTVSATGINAEQAVEELAKLLSGTNITAASIDSARELMLGKR